MATASTEFTVSHVLSFLPEVITKTNTEVLYAKNICQFPNRGFNHHLVLQNLNFETVKKQTMKNRNQTNLTFEKLKPAIN